MTHEQWRDVVLCSLNGNSIGVEGANAIVEALKINKTLTTIT